MESILGLLLVLAALLTIFYQELPLLLGSVVFAVVWLIAGVVAPWLWHPLALLPMLGVLVVINNPTWRVRFLSRPVFRLLAKAMPGISDTERQVLESGATWWEQDLFTGKPDWQRFSAIDPPHLSDEERQFLDNEVVELCEIVDDWEIHDLQDLPERVWQFLKEKGFFGLIIPREYGGKDFGPYAQSLINSKIASRSMTAAVTAMVPNSLGPGELLNKYGTDEQKQRWLPRLARGEEIPCFALTGPEAGSDAGSLPDTGIVCRGEYEGEEVLGIRLNFAKRWITLAPVATVIGLAFKLYDPDGLLGDKEEIGITCALVPARLPGVEIGRRHNPGPPFMNGPVNGRDVFVPLDAIIGGLDGAGQGWRMLVECLGAGRGISLPSLATASGEMSYRLLGAFTRIRRQFNLPVGRFEGVQEATAEVAGMAYTLEAMRMMVTRALEECEPGVVTAMAKYHCTEMMRDVVNHSMDVLGGRGIQLGPRNRIAQAYRALPIAITVEGANILVRSMMIFGQGAFRCHPYLYEEIKTIQGGDSAESHEAFDRLFMAHLAYTGNRASRALVLGLTGGRFGELPEEADGFTRRWYQRLGRFSAVLATSADVAFITLGGALKRREILSARLGDVHSQLFIASAVLKYYAAQPHDAANRAHAEYALQRCFFKAYQALEGFYDNLPGPGVGRVLKRLFFPWGAPVRAPSDEQIRTLGDMIMETSSVRDAFGEHLYIKRDPTDAVGRIELTYEKLLSVEKDYEAFLKAEARGKLTGKTIAERVADAARQGLIPEAQVSEILAYDEMRYDCLLTDAFDKSLKKVDVRPDYRV